MENKTILHSVPEDIQEIVNNYNNNPVNWIVVNSKVGGKLAVLDTPENRVYYNWPPDSQLYKSYNEAISVIRAAITVLLLCVSTFVFSQVSNPCNTDAAYVTAGYVDSTRIRFVQINHYNIYFGVKIEEFKANSKRWLQELATDGKFTHTGHIVKLSFIANDSLVYKLVPVTNLVVRPKYPEYFYDMFREFLFCNNL